MKLTEEQLQRLEKAADAQCTPLGTMVRVTPGELRALLEAYRQLEQQRLGA